MSDIVWKPTKEHLENSNIARFMKANGIQTYAELIRRANENTEWFWQACFDDLKLTWQQPYKQMLDTSQGFPWARWFVDGKINIVQNCLDRHVEQGKAEATAFIWESDGGDVENTTTNIELPTNSIELFGCFLTTSASIALNILKTTCRIWGMSSRLPPYDSRSGWITLEAITISAPRSRSTLAGSGLTIPPSTKKRPS